MLLSLVDPQFTFDSYFSNAENLNHIDCKQNSRGESRAYVGDLKTNRNLEVRGHSIKVDEFAATIKPENRQELRRGDDRQWYFTTTVRLPQVKHPVRIVLIWRNRRDTKLAKVLIANRTHWEINRIVETYPDHVRGSAVGTSGYGIVQFAYDPAGRTKIKTDQLGDTCTFNYDCASRMFRRDYRLLWR